MARLQRRPLDTPAERRTFPRGHIDIVELDDAVIGRFHLEPGWRWSRDVAPAAGTRFCQYHHLGTVLSGVLQVEMEDGTMIHLRPGDAFEIPPGHDSEVISDEPWIAIDYAGSRTFAQAPEERGERVLASILFTDIVDSTARAEAMGDRAWKAMLAEHNAIVDREVDRFRGRSVKTVGDGVLALFDGAERAVRCAAAICQATKAIGLSIRAGVHTGEVELTAGDVRGLAVHMAARILALAGPGQVQVSGTTHDLLAGSPLVFESAGTHELKGFSGSYAVYRLAEVPS